MDRLVVYADFFNRHAARPTRPAPNKRRVEGSGTGVEGGKSVQLIL
jgi:hypothetical protein